MLGLINELARSLESVGTKKALPVSKLKRPDFVSIKLISKVDRQFM